MLQSCVMGWGMAPHLGYRCRWTCKAMGAEGARAGQGSEVKYIHSNVGHGWGVA